MEFKIKPDSNLCNMPIPPERKCWNVIVCAIERGNELNDLNGDFVLQPQDKIFVTGKSDRDRSLPQQCPTSSH